MTSHRYSLYRFYGALIDDVCSKTNLERKSLKKALKDARGIDSLTSLTYSELYDFIQEVLVFFQVEYGIEILTGGEEETLGEYLKRNNYGI